MNTGQGYGNKLFFFIAAFLFMLGVVGCGGGGGSSDTTAPGAFSLSSPANGATDVSLTPSFAWSASSGATSYSVQIKKSTDASYTVVTTTAGTSYQASSALTATTSYDWQVVASNANGTATAGPFTFTTGTPAAQVVSCTGIVTNETVTATATSSFDPAAQTITKGDIVKWVSASTIPHTVTSGTVSGSGQTAVASPDGLFNEQLPSSGSTVCIQFNAVGTYNYYCDFHYKSGMIGSVTVQ